MQITYKARELYKEILVLNPDHAGAKARLEKR
jgi:hypothetical protein